MQTRFNLEGIKSEAEARWPVFRDSAINVFLLAYLDQRITELVSSLKNIAPEDLRRVQGEIAEAQKCRDLLARPSINAPLSELITKLK